MKQVTLAIIGTGVVGERIINQALANPNYIITAIFDENKERLQAMASKYNVPVVDCLDDLLDTNADWVYIGTPPVSHAPLAEKIAARGLNVLSEKPLAHDAVDGERMVNAVKEANVLSAMHFPMMYSPVVQQVKSMLEANELGRIERIELQTYFPHWPRPWQQNPWIASREQGGFIREIFPHYLQVLNHYFGSLEINAHQTTYPEDVTLCEKGVTAFGVADGTIPVVLNALSKVGLEERIDFKIYGSAKSISIRNWSELWVAEVDQAFTQVETTIKPYNLLEGCYRYVTGEEAIIVDFEEGLKVQRWIDELLK